MGERGRRGSRHPRGARLGGVRQGRVGRRWCSGQCVQVGNSLGGVCLEWGLGGRGAEGAGRFEGKKSVASYPSKCNGSCSLHRIGYNAPRPSLAKARGCGWEWGDAGKGWCAYYYCAVAGRALARMWGMGMGDVCVCARQRGCRRGRGEVGRRAGPGGGRGTR